MSLFRNMPCWKIMQCRDADNCPAKENPDIPCWELVEKPKNSACMVNICEDCIVHVIKTGDPILTRKEVDDIIEHRNNNQTGKLPVPEQVSCGYPDGDGQESDPDPEHD